MFVMDAVVAFAAVIRLFTKDANNIGITLLQAIYSMFM